MINIVLKIRKEGRKQFPEAVAAFVERSKADTFAKELIKGGEKEDDVWVEPSFAYEMQEYNRYEYEKKVITENELGDVVYPILFVEARRPVTGSVQCTMRTKKDVELYDEYGWPLDKWEGNKGYIVLQCPLTK